MTGNDRFGVQPGGFVGAASLFVRHYALSLAQMSCCAQCSVSPQVMLSVPGSGKPADDPWCFFVRAIWRFCRRSFSAGPT